MTKYPATLLCDFYKISHREQYPKNTQTVYSTWTPRTSRIPGVNHVVAFGFQAFIKKYLIEYFDTHFFSRPKQEVVNEYPRFIKNTLGVAKPSTKHIEDLHDLGYLPIKIKALAEGSLVPIRVPMLTIENTDDRFFWLTNYLETLMSCELWLPTTSATTAFAYRKLLTKYAKFTGGDLGFVPFQGHDFSMRGMASLEAAMSSGSGHLLSFAGTDTIPAISHLETYYNADITKELVGTSIPATEHSVMCAHGRDEFASYKYLIEDVYPNGLVSIVSDTWDFWGVLDNVIRPLKDSITKRDGKVVIRPDSGDPVKIICGDPDADNELAYKGAIEVLWDIFGGTINEKGYKVLDCHIGCIYGDAITLDRCESICSQLAEKGFASTNIVFGIGSFTYNYVTRDTFGFALKSTHVVIAGQDINIFKNPVTDTAKIKASQIGRVAVLRSLSGDLYLHDGLDSKTELEGDQLTTIFENGKLLVNHNLADIRQRLMEKL